MVTNKAVVDLVGLCQPDTHNAEGTAEVTLPPGRILYLTV